MVCEKLKKCVECFFFVKFDNYVVLKMILVNVILVQKYDDGINISSEKVRQ